MLKGKLCFMNSLFFCFISGDTFYGTLNAATDSAVAPVMVLLLHVQVSETMKETSLTSTAK